VYDHDLAREICKTTDTLKQGATSWWSIWDEIDSYCDTKWSWSYNMDFPPTGQYEKKDSLIYDTTAITDSERHASLMVSTLTPPNSRWAFLAATDSVLSRDDEVRGWLELLGERVFAELYNRDGGWTRSNWQYMLGLSRRGTSAMWVDPIVKRGARRISFQSIPIREILGRQNREGLVDSVFRVFWLTARQANQKDEWREHLPARVVDAVKKSPEEMFKFIHAVSPREDWEPGRPDAKGKPIASYVVCEGGGEPCIVEEGGYRTMPAIVSRFDRREDEFWGRSPMMEVLPDVKSLNELEKNILMESEHRVRPPMLTHNDDIDFDYTPGTVTSGGLTANGDYLVKPALGGQPREGREQGAEMRARIHAAFKMDVLQLLTDRPEMTATQSLELTEEKAALLAPVFLPQYDEYGGPLIDRVIDILIDQERVPPPPEILTQVDLEYGITFDTKLTKMMQSQEGASFGRLWETGMMISTALGGDPSVFDNFSVDRTIRGLARRSTLPASFLATAEEMVEKREARAQQAQQQAMIQAAPAGAAVMKALPALKEMGGGQ